MNRNYKSIIFTFNLLLALSASSSANPGDLDPTFGSGGIVVTNAGVSLYLYSAWGMEIQSDGKIVVVGEATRPSGTYNWDFAVVRYNPNGSLDSSFGSAGIVVTPVGDSHDQATSVAIQADGKIVVAGLSYNDAFGVVRYNTDGSLDNTFNGTGKVITTFGGVSYFAYSVAIQADGKIVVAGGRNGSNSGFALVRYNADGSLDPSFNGTGKVITPGGGAYSVAIQTDGKIVAAGDSRNGSTVFTVIRYNSDGSLDTSFNATGKVITSFGNSISSASQLAIQTDGKIVVVGHSLGVLGNWTTADFAVVRYNSNGSLDTSFGGTGKILIPVGDSGDYATSVALQPNGKIVVAGYSFNPDADFVVVRLNPNGSSDSTFNDTGVVTTSLDNSNDYASAVAIQADGKIVVSGDTGSDDFKDFAVVRYQGDSATPTPTPTPACPNPIDCADFFVTQHYRDFLNREPDAPGLAHWTSEITECSDQAKRHPGESFELCTERKRANTSAAFFFSPEFQNGGSFMLRVYWGTLGKQLNQPGCPGVPFNLPGHCRPRYTDYIADMATVAQGIVVNDALDPNVINNNKRAFVANFITRPEFTAIYGSLTPTQFVDKLAQTTGVPIPDADRTALIAEINANPANKANVVFKVVDGTTTTTGGLLQFDTTYGKAYFDQEFDDVFVFIEYIAYLRRNPDQDGFNHWLGKLKQYGNWVDAQMVLAFILSPEYRSRFGP